MQNHRRKLRNIKRARRRSSRKSSSCFDGFSASTSQPEGGSGTFAPGKTYSRRMAPTTPARRERSGARSASSHQSFLLPARDPAPAQNGSARPPIQAGIRHQFSGPIPTPHVCAQAATQVSLAAGRIHLRIVVVASAVWRLSKQIC